MPNEVIEVLKVITQSLEIVGAGMLIFGFVVITFRWLRQSFSEGTSSAGENYRQAIGRVVLIGLEVLVAATILKTITLESTVDSVSFLAIMVAIRTILGWTMVLEITGRWPWQRPGLPATIPEAKS
ncbi:MAG: DUF1622 domain-containing protein [Gammaproteobacteria bacterium]|nr:DUF1622 domain-containing protein [Gammaproteobacteria bacterium]